MFTILFNLQDFALNCGIIAESFETSVLWTKCELLCSNVKFAIREECRKYKINYFYVNTKVTQTYDSGACVCIYFGFQFIVPGFEIENPLEMYQKIEETARDVVLASGRFHNIFKSIFKYSVFQVALYPIITESVSFVRNGINNQYHRLELTYTKL